MQRIENNVEAFRYYLAFEIWTISIGQDNRQNVSYACVLLYICLLIGRPYTCIKRGIIVLLLTDGQSRASNAMIDDGSHAFFINVACWEQGDNLFLYEENNKFYSTFHDTIIL